MTDQTATPQPIPWLTPARRRWLYSIAIIIIALLAGHDIIADGDVSLWTQLAAAVLGAGVGGTAIAHTPKG